MRLFASLIARFRQAFPNPADYGTAVDDYPLCSGGLLSVPMLLAAYGKGIFPWYSDGQPILWWSPAPRCAITSGRYHLPKRAERAIRKAGFTITLDAAFPEVIRRCGSLRSEGTWITDDMLAAYIKLFHAGYAHSVEAWLGQKLVGGLYGVSLGRAFFGESMFHEVSEASRACLSALASLLHLRGITLLDCQQESNHIMAQGGRMLSRMEFTDLLNNALALRPASTDALTMEYREPDGAVLASMWPYLPWKTRYRYEESGWKAAGLKEIDLSMDAFI